ncbi:MAG: IclR family transcriptional regulator [Anaerolineae bacterium]
MSRNSRRYHIRAVDRALDLLATLSTSEAELTLTEVASRLGLSRSTTYRLLVTLESRSYVERNHQTGGYSLGVACLDLGNGFLSQLDLRERVLPVLQALREECKETVHLGILDTDGMEVIYLEKLVGLLPVVMMGSRVGGRVPAHCTALGKCMLAYVREEVVRDAYCQEGLRSYTPNTITDLDELVRELGETRQRGFAIDDIEHEPAVKCVAAPVWNHEKEVVAAISISAPADRMNEERCLELGPLVREAVLEVSRRMGYMP